LGIPTCDKRNDFTVLCELQKRTDHELVVHDNPDWQVIAMQLVRMRFYTSARVIDEFGDTYRNDRRRSTAKSLGLYSPLQHHV